MRFRTPLARGTAVALTLALLAACGDDDTASSDDDAGGDGGSTSELAAACPETVAVQTGWFPEAEYGPLYQVIGEDGEIDGSAGAYRGEIGDSGVTFEVRAGGPFLGNTQASAQLYLDDSLTMALIDTDEGIENIEEAPTTAVVSYMQVPPQAIIFDPDTYDFQEIGDVGESDATVLVFEGSTYQRWLIGAGLIREEQMDGSYTGAPDQFVSSQGEAVLGSGYASLEPYTFTQLPEWGKALEAMLLYDAGYPIYGSSIAVRTDQLEDDRECLELLVPILQQSIIDYMADPAGVNQVIVDLNTEIGDFWQTTIEQNDYAHDALAGFGTFADGTDGVQGSFDADRMQEILDTVVPVLEETGSDVPDDIAWEDFATNEFLDTSISAGVSAPGQ
ncbi:MAG TPA: hypothetical protein VK611_20665 [Acidimicrobiales bacterium]|nr:hypothetical protein [Acidimicrobiales bacterium]